MRRGSFLGNDPFRPVIPDERFFMEALTLVIAFLPSVLLFLPDLLGY